MHVTIKCIRHSLLTACVIFFLAHYKLSLYIVKCDLDVLERTSNYLNNHCVYRLQSAITCKCIAADELYLIERLIILQINFCVEL
jgi:hypothetical protein